MKSKGKFLLFDLTEFSTWLSGHHVSRTIHVIQNHHTWRPDYKDFSLAPDHFHWLQSMENFQVNQNGFSQIAQNLTTWPDGLIAVGRPFDIAPAGIKGANQFGLCIEHVGNFDIGGDQMSPEQSDTIIKLNAILCRAFGIPVSAVDASGGIIYHHWYDIITGIRTNGSGTTKTCPGTNFFGGNSVQACQASFIPMVEKALVEMDYPNGLTV